ncbi:hypothetical protein HDU97_004901 [Phlyctochytrium planicorne]|nr:hypothetical protein HDU97_004901 [Phlyctochytrium planicorne]
MSTSASAPSLKKARELVSTLDSSYAWDDLGVIVDAQEMEVATHQLPRFLGLYFAAGWSAACRDFTPKLERLTSSHRSHLVIIHIPSDAHPPPLTSSFYRTVNRPLALVAKHNLARRSLGLTFIPSLVIVDRVEKRVVTSAGVPAVNLNGADADLIGLDVRPLRLRLEANPETLRPPTEEITHPAPIVVPGDVSGAVSTPAYETTEKPDVLDSVPIRVEETTWSANDAPVAPAAEGFKSESEDNEEEEEGDDDDDARNNLSASTLLLTTTPLPILPTASTSAYISPELSTLHAPMMEIPPLPNLFQPSASSSPSPSTKSGASVESGLVSLPVSRRSSIANGETSDSDGESRMEDSIVVLGKKDLTSSAIFFKANQ